MRNYLLCSWSKQLNTPFISLSQRFLSEAVLFYPFCRKGNWGTEKSNVLPKVTELISGRTGFESRRCWLQDAFNPCTLYFTNARLPMQPDKGPSSKSITPLKLFLALIPTNHRTQHWSCLQRGIAELVEKTYQVYSFPGAKYHTLGSLHNKNVSSHCSGG